MDKKAYMDEQLNVRLFYLRLWKKLWVLPLAALLGAVIGFLLYGAVTRVTQPAEYEAKTQLYLHFVENATNDKVYDYYNAYTWNDLVHSDRVEALLEEVSGEDDMGETCMRMYREGTLTLSALQPSDIRVLWITATSGNPDCAAHFAETAAHAMELYGESNEVFRSIEVIGTEDVTQVTYPQRGKTAAVTGAVLGAVFAVFALFVLHLLDDAVYVPEDAEKRYGLPVLVVMPAGEDLPAWLEEEAKTNLAPLAARAGAACVLSTADSGTCDALNEQAGRLGFGLHFVPAGEPASAHAPLLLCVQAGKKDAALTAHVLSQARARGQEAEGIVFTGTAFLKRYYGI